MALETGKYLSQGMIDYIDCWTNTSEFMDIAKEHDMSDELARKLARGDRKITDNNLPLITDIIALAIKNRNNRIKGLNKAHKVAIKLA